MGVLDNTVSVNNRNPKSTDAIIVEPSPVAMQQRDRIDPELLSSRMDKLAVRVIELLNNLVAT